ncbi:uncharacterized protein N7503_011592 [Penicillium pulvis]|uniref:uncharacterized protein n=1 Tax=Penicillium pulvis TaxID=1562058 RepID=UPI0025467946|nr:uncharacterized protein N7503_011592 [Penicillium pulvis]KAJ5786380.1 hypothetical protein N7503_011592 [Penicillium pulvis]
MAYQSDPGAPHMWVHVRFNTTRDKDKTDRDLLEYICDEVLHGTTWESSTHDIEIDCMLKMISDPILSIEVPGPFPHDNFIDRLITCDKMMEQWSEQLDRGLGLPFDRRELFKAPGKWNHAAVGIVWNEINQNYHPHSFYGRTVIFMDAVGALRKGEGESRRRRH